jgi:putative transposase
VRWHRVIEGVIKTVRIIHRAGDWYASFTCEIPVPEPLPETGREIGIDMGINALITTSHGDKVDNPKWYREAQADLRLKQRKLSRAKRGSKNRQKKLLIVQRQHEKIVNQRTDFLNKLAYGLVKNFDRIALEDLSINNMVRNHHLSKSILDAGWGYFRRHLTVKAASAGREIDFVNPRYTSKTCSHCGTIFEDMTLAVRWVDCLVCGLSLDRDHNAAIAVLGRARWVTSVKPNVVPLLSPQGESKRKRA